MARDLVCGMKVDEKNPETPRVEYQGNTYYFCTPLCMAQFEADPEKYIYESRQEINRKVHKGAGNQS